MRVIGRLITSAVLLILTLLLTAAGKYLPAPILSLYSTFSKSVSAYISGITGSFPFTLWTVLLVLWILLEIFFLVRCFIKKTGFIRWLCGIVVVSLSLALAFVTLWGCNHFAPPISEQVGLEVTEYSKEQLVSTTQYMAQQASHWADQVQRDENGDLAVDFDVMAKMAGDGYDVLAESNEFFRLSNRTVKPLMASKLFSYMGITGIYIPLTAEVCVNTDTYNASVPFTMCHELAHGLTVAPEDEANFCAFLACINHEDPAFQYSAWYSAYLYTYNALARVDAVTAYALRGTVSQTLLQDIQRASEHYSQYKGSVQEISQTVNDTYLKAFDEESGVQSYGEVADLLIAWYLQK